MGLYYDRPASELVFMPTSMHTSLHMKGKTKSEEHKANLSKAHKGQTPGNKGKHVSEESKLKNALKHLGKKHSEETKAKMSKSHAARQHKLRKSLGD